MNTICDENLIHVISYLNKSNLFNFELINLTLKNLLFENKNIIYSNLLLNYNFKIENNIYYYNFSNKNYTFVIENNLLIFNKFFFKKIYTSWINVNQKFILE